MLDAAGTFLTNWGTGGALPASKASRASRCLAFGAQALSLALLYILLGATGASAGGLADSPWPMFQHDPQHRGRSSHVAPGKLRLEWRFQVKGLPGSPAIGADGTIYLPTGNAPAGTTEDRPGFLYAINPDGTQRWRYEFPPSTNCVIVPTRTTPAVTADGTIYVHTQSGRTVDGSGYCTAGPSFLFAINPDGTTKWTYQLNFGAGVFSSTDLSSPAIAPDGTIYLTSRDAGLYAINPDGTLKWVVGPEGTSIASSPAIGPDGTVYVNVSDLHAYTPNGVEKWEANTGGAAPNDNSPSIAADGTIYACGISPDLCHAVSPAGNINWSFPLEAVTTTPALAADGTIYLVGRTDGLYAVNPDGSQRWHTLFEEPSFGKISHSPVVGADGRLYARDDADVLEGVLYVLNPDGTESDKKLIPAVFPRGPGTGELSPAIGSDGTLYVPEPRAGSGEYNPNDQYVAAYVEAPSGGEEPPDGAEPFDLDLGGRRTQRLGKAVRVKATCDVDCSAAGTGKLVVPKGNGSASVVTVAGTRRLNLKPASAEIAAGETATLKLKISTKARRLAEHALKEGDNVKAKVKVTATDTGGNERSAERTVRLEL